MVLVVTGPANNGFEHKFSGDDLAGEHGQQLQREFGSGGRVSNPGRQLPSPGSAAVPLQVLAVDCAGNAVTDNATADVVVHVPGAPDVEIPLIHQGSGLWTATWTPAMEHLA